LETNFYTNEKAVNRKLEQLENTMKKAIDYMLRHQWKDTRNIVNKALSKVTLPLKLKDLLYVNVGGENHEIFRKKVVNKVANEDETRKEED
jgi:hypothetical protein